ncbi:pyruvate, phosphate dikinase, chloroplastic [Tanacetum coccineum]
MERVKEKNKDVVAKHGVSPSVFEEPMVKEKQSSLVDTSILIVENTDLRSYPPLPTQGSTPTGNTPLESMRVVSERFTNRTYGFFFGKRVAYPVVANYLYGWFECNACKWSMVFRNHPLILKKWNPDVNLLKEDVGNVPVWVKLHGVPITAFSEDGLSSIATKFGTSLMLDSYTSDMCLQSWGRSSYARVIIELQADMELKDTIVVAMPKLTGDGFCTCLGVAKNLKKPSQTPRGVLLEKLIIEGKVTLVNDDGKPLKKVDYAGDHDSEDERDTYESDDYDKDPYNDDMYEVIKEYLVNINKRRAFWSLNGDILKINDSDNQYADKMDDPNITMKEYIRLEEEKARKHGKNEVPAIVYNDALTSKSDFSTDPNLSPQHIDEFDLKDETSLSECDEGEQNVFNFNDLFPFNSFYPRIQIDKVLNERNIDEYWWRIFKSGDHEVLES